MIFPNKSFKSVIDFLSTVFLILDITSAFGTNSPVISIRPIKPSVSKKVLLKFLFEMNSYHRWFEFVQLDPCHYDQCHPVAQQKD